MSEFINSLTAGCRNVAFAAPDSTRFDAAPHTALAGSPPAASTAPQPADSTAACDAVVVASGLAARNLLLMQRGAIRPSNLFARGPVQGSCNGLSATVLRACIELALISDREGMSSSLLETNIC